MFQVLCAQFGKVISFSKTKIFFTNEMNVPHVAIVKDDRIDVATVNCSHKCFGKNTVVFSQNVANIEHI